MKIVFFPNKERITIYNEDMTIHSSKTDDVIVVSWPFALWSLDLWPPKKFGRRRKKSVYDGDALTFSADDVKKRLRTGDDLGFTPPPW